MKPIATYILLISVLLSVTSAAFAGDNAASFSVVNTPDNSWVTSKNRVDGNGVVRAMYNINSRTTGATPEQIARTFLQANGHAFHLTGMTTTLQTNEIQTVQGSSHVRFNQTYEGVPVFRGDVVVSISNDNEISMVTNNFKDAINLASTTPSLTQETALQIARQHVGIRGRTTGQNDNAILMIFRADNGIDHLAYKVSMTNEDPMGDWQVFVDAMTGDVLNVEDLFVNERVQGSGYVYLSDPLSTARKIYNSIGFADNNDADSDSLTAYRSLVTLDSITFESGVYKLKGSYCNVTDIESPSDPVFFAANSPNGFNNTRSQQEFEAVNVYYHVSNSYKRLLELGFSVPSLTQIRLDPHGYLGQDNSHYSPGGNWIAWGEGGVDDAEDADVIWHEYGHAIMYNIITNWGGGECGALGEGFGDYWAGSYSRSLNQWSALDNQYNWVFNWDGHNAYWLGRSLNDSRSYPFGGLEIHSAGQIWSSALMGILGDLGRDISDRLVIKSFYYLGSGTTGADAAEAILQADRDLYGGAHIQTLAYWLGTVKHFISAPLPIQLASFTGTVMNDHTVRLDWTTISELNNYGFYLQKRHQGDSTWSEIQGSFVSGHGTTNEPQQYSFSDNTATNGIWQYRLKQIDLGGSTFFSEPIQVDVVTDVKEIVPLQFALQQNYPNPFNPATEISYSLAALSIVTLKIHNAIGQEIATLVDQPQSAGWHEVKWDGRNTGGTQVSSGIYFYRIEAKSAIGAEGFVQLKKMTLLK